LRGLALDNQGNLYFGQGYRAYRMAPSGEVTVFAGSRPGFAGDGGPATQADLNGPVGLATDAAGNVYIADYLNGRVRKVAPDGTISTVAGNSVQNDPVDGVPATDSPLKGPVGLAVDSSGNLFIADQSAASVLRVGSDGTLHVLAGTAGYGFSGDGGPAAAATST